MARKVGSIGAKTKQAINHAAAELFASQGYANVSLREVAEKVNLQVGSLYNHINSKQELLFSITDDAWKGYIRDYDELVAIQPDPVNKLRAVVRVILRRFVERANVQIATGIQLHTQLLPKHANIIRKYNETYLENVRGILREGAEQGVFEIADVRLCARAILGLLRDVFSWYHLDGRYTVEQLIEIYDGYVLKLVGMSPKSLERGVPSASKPQRAKNRPKPGK